MVKTKKEREKEDLEINANAEALQLLAELEEKLGREDVDLVEVLNGATAAIFVACLSFGGCH